MKTKIVMIERKVACDAACVIRDEIFNLKHGPWKLDSKKPHMKFLRSLLRKLNAAAREGIDKDD